MSCWVIIVKFSNFLFQFSPFSTLIIYVRTGFLAQVAFNDPKADSYPRCCCEVCKVIEVLQAKKWWHSCQFGFIFLSLSHLLFWKIFYCAHPVWIDGMFLIKTLDCKILQILSNFGTSEFIYLGILMNFRFLRYTKNVQFCESWWHT